MQKFDVSRPFLSPKRPPRDPPGDQKGAKKSPKTKKVTFWKSLFYVGGSIKSEAGGDQKAPQGPPKTKSKIEEKTKTKKEDKKGAKSGHADHQREDDATMVGPGRPAGGVGGESIKQQRLII